MDEKKNALNQAKHGISFEEATLRWNGFVFTREDTRRNYGEARRLALGLLARAAVILVTYTHRHGRIRIISARKASRKERVVYYAYLKEAAERN